HALLRRVDRLPQQAGASISIGDVTLDPETRRVVRSGRPVHLTPTEFDLLHRLALKPGVVHSREQLLVQVWGYRNGTGGRTVDSHIGALRRKLGSGILRTVHGVGYAVETGSTEPDAAAN
ncbi:MAG: winged helix-turn-helix domain-containing protein, partial [Actinomycetota bacterium]